MEYMLDMRFCLYFVSSSHMSLIFITDRIKEKMVFKSILSLNFQEKTEKRKNIVWISLFPIWGMLSLILYID